MAYVHQKHQIVLTPDAVSALTSGEVGQRFTPGYIPYVIRAVSLIPTLSGVVYTSVQVDFKKIDLTSGSTASTFETIYGVATDKPGHVIYADGLDVEVGPGEAVFANLTVIATSTASAGAFKVALYVEPRWETPANDSDMRETT